MIQLRTLGPLDLTGDDGSELRAILAQPKRLALLTFLAVAGKGGFQRRDHLLAVFWPERDSEQARAALNRAIYYLRRSVGEGVVLSRGDELGLASQRFWCDAALFEHAVAGGDHRQAVELYRGDFLEGFFVSDAPGFEEWLDVHRRHLRTAACNAAWSLAELADAAGKRAEAVTWGRWAVERSPIDEAGVQRLVRLFDHAGDRAGAVLVYEEFAQRLAADLELSPSPETIALVASIRGRAHAWPDSMAPARAARSSTAPGAVPVRAETHREDGLRLRPTAPVPPIQKVRRVVFSAVAAGVLVTLSVLVALRPSTIPFADRGWVLIGDFENTTGDRSFDRTLDLALATALRQSTRINVVPRGEVQATLRRMRRSAADSQVTESIALEVARRDGIPVVVLGRIDKVGTRYWVTLRAIDVATRGDWRTRKASADAKTDVVAALDELSVHLRTELGESGRMIGKAISLPKATTSSIEALEKYAAGLRAMDAGLYPEAAELLRAAIRLDTNFAMAHGALGQVYYGAQWRVDGDRHFDRALALAERLTERERMSIRIQAAGSRGNRPEAMKLLRAYLSEFPDDQRGWAQLGYEAFRSRSPREALSAYSSAARIRPLQAVDWTNIASTYSNLGQNDSALIAYAQAFKIDPELETWVWHNNQYGKALIFAGRFEEATTTFEKMLSRPAVDRARGLRSLAYLDLYRGNYQSAVERMKEATLIMAGEPTIEMRNRLAVASILHERGQEEMARQERNRVGGHFAEKYMPPRLLLFMGKPLARDGNVAVAARILDTLRARARADNPEDQSDLAVLEGEVALARGNRAQAIESLERAFRLDSTKYALESLAHGAAATGDLSTAAARYEKLAAGQEFGWEPQQYWRFARYWLGVVQETRGDRQLAIESYRRFLSEWEGADPALPVIRDARRRMERLVRVTEHSSP